MKWIQGSLVIFALSLTNSVMAAPEGVSLRSVGFAGSGCPASSSELGAVLDQEAGLVLTLPSMLIEWGPSVAKVLSRKNCIITLDVAVPEGWQYSLGTVENRGYVKLDAGLRAELVTQHFFEGGPGQRMAQTFEGPVEKDFWIRDVLPIGSQIWSNCALSRRLSINTLLRILPLSPQNPGEATGLFELGSHWEPNTLKLQLNWRPCPA